MRRLLFRVVVCARLHAQWLLSKECYEDADDRLRRARQVGGRGWKFQRVGLVESEWLDRMRALNAEVQEALDDPSPLVEHDEAVRKIRAAIRVK